MAELATGAVNTLLGVIRNEARRLKRVRGDVQFIQEEMESMNSFLAHVARTRGEEQDEQVRTWMNQVRILANDCNNCLDVYLYRGNPNFHRPRTGVTHYLWLGWPLWCLRVLMAQHRAAGQLRELKERARDVGERRLRYGVKLNLSAGKSSSSPGGPVAGATAALTAEEEEEEEEDDDEQDPHGDVPAAPSALADGYFKERLVQWIQGKTRDVAAAKEGSPNPIPSIVFVLPGTKDAQAATALADHALKEAKRHFKWSVLVDVPAVHWDFLPLRCKEILYYILCGMDELAKPSQPQQDPRNDDPWFTKWGIDFNKRMLLREIKNSIQEMKVDEKFQEMEHQVICKVEHDQQLLQEMEKRKKHELKEKIANTDLVELLWLLIRITTDLAEQDQPRKKAIRTLSALYDVIIRTTASKLKNRMEDASTDSQKQVPRQQQISLDHAGYERILKEIFPRASTSNGTNTGTSLEDQIKEMIDKTKEMIQDLQEYNKYEKNRDTGGPNQNPESAFQEAAKKKLEELKTKIREQLKIKGIMDKITNHLQAESSSTDNVEAESLSKNNLEAGRILIILKTDPKYISIWEDTRNTLSLLGTSKYFAGAAIVATTTTKSTAQATEDYFSDTQLEPIEYSLVGCYLDIVRQYKSKHMDEDKLKIVHNILEKCEPHEFCMDIFAHALKANPKRTTEELRRILQARRASIAKKLLKFSYNDLPKQHKSCFLYLVIFPPESYIIRRSTLIGRWVAEGLITTEDWCWSSSVAEAEKCFQSLINRKLVCPVDIGASGRVKTCMVHPLVHGFIKKIATKQHIVEARLSLDLARHFSIFNDVRLRRTDTIKTFLEKNIHDLTQISKLKVLDLQGCQLFANNRGYLKDICSKILMLKYLSLRETDCDQLPREINNLHELEVLDIRQTKIPAHATRQVLLLKLKHLLAGRIIDPSPRINDTSMAEDFSSVEIPELIENMTDVEVLSNVKPRKRRDLKDIGYLCQLKKLGVVIHKDSHLRRLLKTINNLEYLRSLSITLNIPRHEGTAPGAGSLNQPKPPKCLERLSISGSTQMGQLLPLLVTEDSQSLATVTLSRTSLKQDDLKGLARLSNLCCIRLQHEAYIDSELTFNKGEFPKLNLLIVNCPEITTISFTGEAPKLEKIIWSFTNIESLSGIGNIPRLKELELNGDTVPSEVERDIKSIHGLVYKYNKKEESQDQAEGNAREEDHGAARRPSFWEVWRRRN